MNVQIVGVLIAVTCLPALAISPVPEKGGFKGFVSVGVAGGSVKSNVVAELSGADLSDPSLESITKAPTDENVTVPVLAYELSYTFEETRTQIFLGQLLEDFIRFDSSTRAGIRQDLAGAGVASFSVLATPTSTKVWRDPLQTQVDGDRKGTDRNTQGVRVAWGNIMGSGLELRYAWRDLELDDDENGFAQVANGTISAEQQRLLRREGEIVNMDMRYIWKWSQNNSFDVGLSYNDYDLDGKAAAWDGYEVDITHIYFTGQWRLITNVLAGQFEAGGVNPVYGKAADYDRVGATFTAFYADPFGLKGWNASTGIIYLEEDNDIDFYDNTMTLLNVGMLYRF